MWLLHSKCDLIDLPDHIHFSETTLKHKVYGGLVMFDLFTLDVGYQAIQVNTIGQSVAILICSIPYKTIHISANIYGPKLQLSDLPYDLTCNGHDLDLEISWDL